MKLSVAMATYNGGDYLQQQLDSLLSQVRRPDELVISDDRSDDRTPEIIARFAGTAPFSVVTRSNDQRLGYIKNFERAVDLCTGDAIFLADQDDRWHPEKLAKHEAVYLARPEVGGVIGDAAVVDRELRPLGFSLWRHMGMHPNRVAKFRSGRGLDLFIRRGFCYGILLSFRSKYRDVLLPFPLNFSHDDWISLLLSTITQIDLIPEALVDYRQHQAQAIGVGLFSKPVTTVAGDKPENYYGPEIALGRVAAFEERINRFPDRLIRRDVARVIRGRRAYLERRRSIPPRGTLRRYLAIARNLITGDYLRYASYPKMELLSDLRDD